MRTLRNRIVILICTILALTLLFGGQLLLPAALRSSAQVAARNSVGPAKPAPGPENSATATASDADAQQSSGSDLKKAYGKLPMSFEANQGQTDSQVKFFSHGHGYNLFLTPTEAVMVLGLSPSNRSKQESLSADTKTGRRARQGAAPSVLRIKLLNAGQQTAMNGVDELPGKVITTSAATLNSG